MRRWYSPDSENLHDPHAAGIATPRFRNRQHQVALRAAAVFGMTARCVVRKAPLIRRFAPPSPRDAGRRRAVALRFVPSPRASRGERVPEGWVRGAFRDALRLRSPLIRRCAPPSSGPRAQRSGVHRRASQWLANTPLHPRCAERRNTTPVDSVVAAGETRAVYQDGLRRSPSCRPCPLQRTPMPARRSA